MWRWLLRNFAPANTFCTFCWCFLVILFYGCFHLLLVLFTFTALLRLWSDFDMTSSCRYVTIQWRHFITQITTTYNEVKDEVECVAMRAFQEGEQVTICYGTRGNSDLLIHNGFLIKNNPHDKVKIPFGKWGIENLSKYLNKAIRIYCIRLLY